MITTINICIFGDSIAYGAWDEHGGWVDRLRSYLHGLTLASHFQSYYFLYNLGIPGDTTADVIKRFSAECEAREPHVIIFAAGINDASCRGNRDTSRIAPEQFKENVRVLVESAKLRTDKANRWMNLVIWVGLTAVDETRTTPFEDTYFSNERITAYDQMIRTACTQSQILYINLSSALQPHDLQDGLHPNRAGHEKLFVLIRDSLKDLKII